MSPPFLPAGINLSSQHPYDSGSNMHSNYAKSNSDYLRNIREELLSKKKKLKSILTLSCAASLLPLYNLLFYKFIGIIAFLNLWH